MNRNRLVPAVVLVFGIVAGPTAFTGTASAIAGDGNPVDASLYVARAGAHAPCVAMDRTLTGTIEGADARVVNAQLAFDLFDSHNRIRDGYGCGDPHAYGLTIHVNYTVPAQGADPAAVPQAVTTWSVRLPADVTGANLEVYPKQSSSQARFGATSTTHYGMVDLPKLKLHAGANGPVHVVLPTANCSDPHPTGTVVGHFYDGNKPAKGVRLSFFSEFAPGKDARVSGPGGLALWNGTHGGAVSYTLPMVASGPGKGQPYVVLARLANGKTKRFLMDDVVHHRQVAGVQPCRTTRFDLHF